MQSTELALPPISAYRGVVVGLAGEDRAALAHLVEGVVVEEVDTAYNIDVQHDHTHEHPLVDRRTLRQTIDCNR